MKIKKILYSLIIGIGILNFSNAYDIPGIGIYGNSTVVLSEDYNITTTWKGIDTFNGFYTEYAYSSSNIDRYGFGWIDGKLYMVSFSRNGSNVRSRQGFFNSYCLADLNSTCNNFTSPINEFYLAMQNGFNSFTIYRGTSFRESLIFCFGNNTNNYCLGISPWIDGNKQSSTTGDLNYNINDLTFESFQDIGWGNSPYSSSNNTTVNQLSCPTIQQLINNFETQYNTGLCYSSNLIYSGGQFQQVTPKTIFELYPQYQDFINDINTYYNYCKPPSTQETCGNAFTGKTEEWTLISKLPDNVTPVNVYNYCNYTLNLDPNQTICTTSTGNLNPGGITVEDNIDNINRLPITVVTPGKPPQEEGNGTGSIFDKYTQQEDETKRRDIIGKAENTIETMKEIYTKLSGIFRAREGKDGIIPPLITGMIALILLFKLWKK